MSPEAFQDLYKMLRGSRAATEVLDARALFMDGNFTLAEKKLTQARETFSSSRARLMRLAPEKQVDAKSKDFDRQVKKVKRKQEKTEDALKAFDEMMPQLKRLASRHAKEQARKAERSERESQEPQAEAAGIADLTADLKHALVEAGSDARLDLINHHFGFREVDSEDDLLGNSLYYIQTKGMALLVVTPDRAEMEEQINLSDPVANRTIKPFSRGDFLKLGASRKMVLLTKQEAEQDPSSNSDDEIQQSSAATSGNAESGTATSDDGATDQVAPQATDIPQDRDGSDQKVLDLGAFSQLLTSAQRSGLVPDADQVGYVRDREFRMGKYDLAFQTIDQMYSRFTTSAGQRVQRLTREDADISAGRIKISPKDLQAKRARDRTQTQEIERAKRRFQVVLEGLRVLMNTQTSS